MNPLFPTIILRHRRENLKKCSLRGLETNPHFRFFTYPEDPLPDLSSYILLDVGAPVLTKADQAKGLFLIDGTWRLAAIMQKQSPKIERRSLPYGFRTAYPRCQTACPDPEHGLASIEALYLAHLILERSPLDILDHYYWKSGFLQMNAPLLAEFSK